jgi:hypothetical protein
MTSGRVQDPGRVHASGRVHRRPHGLLDIVRQGNLGALVLPLCLLVAGGVARARLSRKTVAFTWHGVELRHPAGWTVAERSTDPADGDSVVLMDLLGPGRIKPRVTLRNTLLPAVPPLPDPEAAAPSRDDANDPHDGPDAADAKGPSPRPGDADAIARPAAVAETLSNRLPLYYQMAEQTVQVGGFAGTRVDSAFAFTPRAIPGRKGDVPVVLRAIDLVVLRGPDALSIQVAAPIDDFEAQRPTLEAIIESLRIDPTTAMETEPKEVVADPLAQAGGETEGPGGVIMAGQVVDAASGLPVPGAIVLFLAPGTNVSDVTDDNLTEIAYTTGLADSTGHFASNHALGRHAHYGVMVVADGFRWIGSDDGVSVEDDTPAHLDVGTVRLRRR